VNFRFISISSGTAVRLMQAAGLAALWTTATSAQTEPNAASTAPTGYRSAFENYQTYTDEKVINWKAANDNTGRIGGWQAYAKEAAQPAQTQHMPQMPQIPATAGDGEGAAKSNPHAGHGTP